MHAPSLIFIGFTNIDINITPQGKTTIPGGAAYFGALAASKLMQSVGLVTRVGKDFDTEFLFSRVLHEGIHVIHDKPTAKSIQTYHSLEDLTDRQITLEWGVAPDLCPTDIPTDWLTTATHIHVATMPPRQQQLFIDFLQKHAPHALLSLDIELALLTTPELRTITEQNFSRVTTAFVNKREYETFTSVIHSLPQAIVKLDKNGALYMTHGHIQEQVTTERVDALDVTGAGDIFAGTFLAAQVLKKNIHDSLQLATKTATDSVTHIGIQHLFS